MISNRYWATLGLLSLAGAGCALSLRRPPEALVKPLESVGVEIAGWKFVAPEPLAPSALAKIQATEVLSRRYSDGPHQLGLFIAYYAQQRAGESMHSPKRCLPGSGWEIWKQDSATVPVRGKPVEINKYSIQNSGRRMLAFYWYQSRSRIVASEYAGKLFLIRDALFDGHTASSIVRITTTDDPASSAAAVDFAASLIGNLQQALGE